MSLHKIEHPVRRFRLAPTFRMCGFGIIGVIVTLVVGVSPALALEGVATSGNAAEISMTHRMMVLALQLGVIVFAARLCGMLFDRIRLPSVLGELAAGILVGPYVLGSLPIPGFLHGLFHLPPSMAVSGLSVSPELYGIGALAAIVLLFIVGIETDLRLFARYSLAGGLAGIGGVIVSFLAGAFLMKLLSPMVLGRSLGLLAPECLMMGVISTATSVGIPARILADTRKLDTPEGVTLLAAAVIDDVLGIILLAVVMGLVSVSGVAGGRADWGRVAIVAFKAVGFWLLATAIGLLAARRIGGLLKRFHHRTTIAVMALGMALIVAGLFEEAGLAMVVGAYVCGLSLARTDLRHVIQERLSVLHEFLVPVFFAVMGMLVDVRYLLSPRILMFGVLFFLAGGVAKVLGCGVPTLVAGFNWRGGLRIGLGMLPRGEVTLLMAGVGLASGALSPELLGAVVPLTLLSALLAPPLMVRSFRGNRSGLRREAPQRDQEVVFNFPSPTVSAMLADKLVEGFETEGFFVHRIHRTAGLYQICKDAVVIGFRLADASIIFRCDPSDVPFVRTVMMEVIAELERTVRELRKPLDVGQMRADLRDLPAIQSPGSSETPQSILLQTLNVRTLVPRIEADTPEAVIGVLLDRLCAVGAVQNRSVALQAVLEREKSLPTGLGHGIALPHARTDVVSRLTCAIGLKPEGVDFGAPDGEPARIVVLTLAPRQMGVPYMRMIATLGQVLDARGRAALLACDTAEDMLAALTQVPESGGFFRSSRRRRRKRMDRTAWTDCLSPARVIIGLTGQTREAVIEELMCVCTGDPAILDATAAHEAVLLRETCMSTAVGQGVALPHARTPAVSRMICAVGIHPQGVDFHAADGMPTTIVVLTLAPLNSTQAYAALIARVVRSLDGEGRRALLGAGTAEAVLRVFAER